MPQRLSYTDAVKILGGKGPLAKAIDNLLGGALSVATAGGSELAISLFDAKTEVIRLGELVTAQINDAVRGLGRHERSERLQAAHAVLVVVSFFEAFDDCLTEAGVGNPGFDRDEQLRFAAEPSGNTLITSILTSHIPLPAPDLSYAEMLAVLRDFFHEATGRMGTHLTGFAVWDRADERARQTVTTLLDGRLPGEAVARYDEHHRRLAEEIPEFAIWAGHLEARAVSHGLDRLESMLLRASSGRDPSQHRAAMARAYRARLTRPVLSGDAGNVLLPALGAAYLDPIFRLKAAGPDARPADDSWWSDIPTRSDLAGCLASHLTTTQATEAPMLLLGQPGAGKSSLTQILAGRLPADDFFVCRVALREVPAEADIQDQIERAVRAEIGEAVSWAELARDAGGALPVVLLDGFDELLQATGLHQSDYLQRVAHFQQREATLGRPVAVMVTSRVAVADRARLPAGSLAVRLEPFDDAQIESWVKVWNDTNPRLEPLPLDALRRLRHLAEQPLLLLMLALYDATGHALQSADLDGGRLYENLLASFAEREVRRLHAGQPESAIPALVEQELQRLSVVAFAMFHRLRLWTTERELDGDLAGLGLAASRSAHTESFDPLITAGQEMVGRFFFIQRAQALRDDKTLRTYEFLHATFGEYLVARLVVQAVRDTEARDAAGRLSLRPGPVNDDDLMRSLLGFTPLTARGTVLPFIADLLDDPDRDRLRAWLTSRTSQAVTRPAYAETRYRPIEKRVDHWMATYSFNLMLVTLACRGPLRASDLFTQTDDPAYWMRGAALQWRAAVPSEMYMDAMEILTVTRDRHNGRRDIVVEYSDWTGALPGPSDADWIIPIEADQRDQEVVAGFSFPSAIRSMYLSNNLSDNVLLHAVEPLIHHLPEALTHFTPDDNGRHESAARSLLRLWLAVARNAAPEDLLAAFEDAANSATYDAWQNREIRTASEGTTELVLSTVRAEAHRLPAHEVCGIVHMLIDEAVVSVRAAGFAVECLVASGAVGTPRDGDHFYGDSLVSQLIRDHPGVGSRVLVSALRAMAPRGDRADVVAYLQETGRLPDLERIDAALVQQLFEVT
ncbi:NACHT domain-containing protein [Actinoplanes sp. GCM10030250]|uniref:NACHT domain-containing protein n=1 Tax=Actinoplanes sp. GCM10030250 TaxID=3273376 RepID=UPI0036122A13